MSLIPASTDRASTPANETTAADSVQFRPEIGALSLCVDTTAKLILLPSPVATLAEALSPVASASFPSPKRRPCEHCGKELVRKEAESRHHFKTRRFCGQICAARSRPSSEATPTRICRTCGKPYERRAPKESPTRFAARRYCSTTCAHSGFGKFGSTGLLDKCREERALRDDLPFPTPKDRGREKQLYAGERYDAPGRTVVITRAADPMILRPSTYVYSEATS